VLVIRVQSRQSKTLVPGKYNASTAHRPFLSVEYNGGKGEMQRSQVLQSTDLVDT